MICIYVTRYTQMISGLVISRPVCFYLCSVCSMDLCKCMQGNMCCILCYVLIAESFSVCLSICLSVSRSLACSLVDFVLFSVFFVEIYFEQCAFNKMLLEYYIAYSF